MRTGMWWDYREKGDVVFYEQSCVVRLSVIFSLLLCILLPAIQGFSKQIDSFLYVSPKPESDLVSRETNIILLYGETIDESCLSDPAIVHVTGSKSGRHTGELILSDDEKTMVFSPHERFEPDETVAVTLCEGLKTLQGKRVESFSFSFTITPLSERIILEDSLIDRFDRSAQSTSSVFSKSGCPKSVINDSLPEDFPEFIINVTGQTAPGFLFGGNNSEDPETSNFRMILDNSGSPVYYERKLATKGGGLKMQPNGYLSYADPVPGDHTYIHMIMDTSYSVADSFQMGNGYISDNHDFQLMPNGHALMIATDLQPVDMSQIVEGGNPNALVYGSIVQELDKDKNVVFQWRSWDYYDLTDSYEDLTRRKFDAIHINSVELDLDGNILLSPRALSEVTKISRSTGEILWRLGGKNNEFSFIGEHEENAPTYFKYQHNVRRLSDGNLILFDNGAQKRDEVRTYSRAVEYALDETNKTATLVWEYRHDPEILALTGGNAQRLPNGNTLISWGGATFDGAPSVTEIQPDGSVVFEMFFAEKKIKGGFTRHLWKGPDLGTSVTLYELYQFNTYSFNEPGDTTGTTITFDALDGFVYNQVTVNLLPYAPLTPEFDEKAPHVFPYRIVIADYFIDSLVAEISFDLDVFTEVTQPEDVIVYRRPSEGEGIFCPLETTYGVGDNELIVTVKQFGEFVFARPDVESLLLAPELVSPLDNERVNQTLPLEIRWNPRGLVNQYHLQVATDSLFTSPLVKDTTLKSTSFLLDTLEENQEYFWRVFSINDAGNSDWSRIMCFIASDPYIAVGYPNGGEILHADSITIIRWNDNITEAVIIDLLKGGNDCGLVGSTTSETGAYSWRVPDSLLSGTDYKIRITSSEDNTLFDESDNVFTVEESWSHAPEDGSILTGFQLGQNFPNPFNPETTIRYQLPKSGNVTIRIYELLGQEVRTLVSGRKAAGIHQIVWDGKDNNAKEVSSGIYIYCLEAGGRLKSKKMLFLK